MNKRLRKSIFCLLIAALILGGNLFITNEAAAGSNNYQLLVRFENNPKVQVFSFATQNQLEQALKSYQNDPSVEVVERNSFYKISYTPNDSFYQEQWALKKIKASQAWDLIRSSKDVVIAVLDTGVDLDHPDLKDNIWINKNEIANDGIDNDNNGYIDDIYGWDFITNTSDPQPKFSASYNEAGIQHGTIVAGIAAAVGDNGQGITGVSYNSKIMSLRVLNNEGVGDTGSVIRAVDYAIDKKVDVINMSFVGHDRSELFYDALKRAYAAGIVIVAAAGNDTADVGDDLDENLVYPVCFDADDEDNFIIGVAALDENNEKAEFSNFGSKCVDISAPGTKSYSAQVYNPDESFVDYYGGYWSGTSVAAPLVSGTAALIRSVNSQISVDKVREYILNKADDIDAYNSDYLGQLGSGGLNAYQAVKAAYTEMRLAPQARYILTGAGKGGGPQVRIFKSNSLAISSFFAYNENFRDGINVTAGDVNGDGKEEIITGANEGGGPHVRIFDAQEKLVSHFFAFDKSFRGGINVAAGDLDRDGIAEIIVAPQGDFSPQVRVFDYQGNLKSQFYAYDINFKGGVSVATSDLDGNGVKEIITGPMSHGGPQVRVFDIKGNAKQQFFAYLESFHGGIKVAAGDVNGNGKDEIIVSIASDASPYIRVFDQSNNLMAQFLVYDRDFYYGVNIASADLDGDGRAEIITGPGVGGGPQVRIFDYQGNVKSQFFAYFEDFRGGCDVSTVSIH